MSDTRLSRRAFLAAASTLPLFTPAVLRAETPQPDVVADDFTSTTMRRVDPYPG